MPEKNRANVPFNPARWPFFYGWMILIWGTLGVLMSIPGQTIGVSVFTESLLDVLHISRDQLSIAYMIGTIGSSFMLPLAGILYDRFGVRPVAFCASVGLGFTLWVLSNINTFIFSFLHISSSYIVVTVMVFAFLFLRFFGQGVLTMTSRNMMMQWFDQRRGFATGFSNVFVSLSFSGAPVFLYFLIDHYTWSGAWWILSIIAGFIFPLVILAFYRNQPESSGLKPDGNFTISDKRKKKQFPVVRAFTLKEVLRNYSFWVFALMLAMQGLFITGITFHVLSIFEEAGLPESEAITVFQPSAVIAVIITLTASYFSDFIRLKYLLYIKGTGAFFALGGIIFLSEGNMAYYMLILGTGIMSGLFSVLNSVTWPRYFGRKHLGAISGQAMMMLVFGSALGPVLFSLSLSITESYSLACWICLGIYVLLTLAAVRADNPQIKLKMQEIEK